MQILHDAVGASVRVSIGGSGGLKARSLKRAANAHAIFARWKRASEFMQTNASGLSVACVSSTNVRPRTSAYASEYFHFEFATTTRDLQAPCSFDGWRIRADGVGELDRWSSQVAKFAGATLLAARDASPKSKRIFLARFSKGLADVV